MDHHEPAPGLPPGQSSSSRAQRGAVIGATAVLSGLVLFQAPMLWREWQELRRDWEQVRVSRPLGFIDISPNPSYARPPEPWYRQQGEELQLWAGWEEGAGHRWFRVKPDEVKVTSLSKPFGRDIVRAIDRTLLETAGGSHWNQMEPDAWVVGLETAGAACVYPVQLLDKVEAVNDHVGGHPVLVLYTPFQPLDQAVNVYDPVVDGQYLTFGHSGYLLEEARGPLLYDRQTESLWAVQEQDLTCLAGQLKGTNLRRIEHAVPVAWADWVAEHPKSQLVVGADRPRAPRKLRVHAAPVARAGRSADS